MKNLLVTNGTQKATLESLTRGDYAIVKADGTVLATDAAFPTKGMYKYVVGIGDGKYISGLWLNAENKNATKQSYSAGAVKTVTIESVSFDANLVTDAEIHIQTQPKNSFAGLDYQEFVAVVPIVSTTQDEDVIEAALVEEVKNVVAHINSYFGKNVIGVTGDSLTGMVFTAVSTDFNFYVNFGGAAKGTTTEDNTLTFGTKAEVVKLEKEMAVATFGYNPNFDNGDTAYGNVLLAGDIDATGYDMYVITSVAPATGMMPLHPDGAEVEQWIAVAKGKNFKTE